MLVKHFLRAEILSRLIFSSDGGRYYLRATEQQSARRALPEEIIRQCFVLSLIHDYKYPEERIRLERRIQVGQKRIRADIVVLDEVDNVSIIVEVKVKTDQHSMGQLRSYMAIEGARYGVLVSASAIECVEMTFARDVVSIGDIPAFGSYSPRASDRIPELIPAEPVLPNQNKVQPEIKVEVDHESLLQQQIGISRFERISESRADITIRGVTLRLPVDDIYSYKRLQKNFLRQGVALVPGIRNEKWFALFSRLFESSPSPVQSITQLDSVSVLIEYLKTYADERLIVGRRGVGVAGEIVRPLKEVSQRYEEDEGMLWIRRTHIKQYCESKRYGYARVRRELFEKDILLARDSRKVLGAGTDLSAGNAIPCWKIDMAHSDLKNMF